MRGNLPLRIASVLTFILIMSSGVQGLENWPSQFDWQNQLDWQSQRDWQNQFDKNKTKEPRDSVLSFDDVLNLVANENRIFQSFSLQLKAAKYDLDQAGLWSNPELSAEIEEVGWNAPGISQSEFSIAISQEFEFFGQKYARKNLARTEIDATRLRFNLAAFDLYLKTKLRFYTLAHAQQTVLFSQASLELAREIVDNITYRLDKGAALQSELLLAELEMQRSQLALDQAEQDLIATEAGLASLWNGEISGMRVNVNLEPDFGELLQYLSSISIHIDSTREVVQVLGDSTSLGAQQRLLAAESKPAITLSGGFKRFEIDNSKSFLFGISMPLPFLNKNQGARKSIEAQMLAKHFEMEQMRNETRADIQSHTIRLNQLISKHISLDTLLLPTAKKAYRTLQSAYEAGRIPYTQLLEAERYLNDLNYEHNDMLMAIQEQIIAMEQLSGIALRLDKENLK